MIRRPTVYEGSISQRIQEDLRASKQRIEPDGVHPRAVSRSDVNADSDFERRILLALVEAQASWITSADRGGLRRQLIALLADLES
jgi:hypothetical protein